MKDRCRRQPLWEKKISPKTSPFFGTNLWSNISQLNCKKNGTISENTQKSHISHTIYKRTSSENLRKNRYNTEKLGKKQEDCLVFLVLKNSIKIALVSKKSKRQLRQEKATQSKYGSTSQFSIKSQLSYINNPRTMIELQKWFRIGVWKVQTIENKLTLQFCSQRGKPEQIV